jgi:hypothetical protein
MNVLEQIKLIKENASKSCQEKSWKRPKQIAFNAREPGSVTWGGKNVNNCIKDSFPGKGKETR